MNRKDILLRAAYDMLKSASDNYCVRSPLEIYTRYDDADCDGMCLMEDIAVELDLEDGTDTPPIPFGFDQ